VIPRLKSILRLSDLRGISQLGIDALIGITGVVESLHHTIASRPGIVGPRPVGRPSGITGFVYRTVRKTPRVVGHGIIALGGGRRMMDDEIDPSVGFVITVKPGDHVKEGERIVVSVGNGCGNA